MGFIYFKMEKFILSFDLINIMWRIFIYGIIRAVNTVNLDSGCCFINNVNFTAIYES